jgi:hypothetical protein
MFKLLAGFDGRRFTSELYDVTCLAPTAQLEFIHPFPFWLFSAKDCPSLPRNPRKEMPIGISLNGDLGPARVVARAVVKRFNRLLCSVKSRGYRPLIRSKRLTSELPRLQRILILAAEILYFLWQPPRLRRKVRDRLVSLLAGGGTLVLVWGGYRLEQDWNAFLQDDGGLRLQTTRLVDDPERPYRISLVEPACVPRGG